MSQSDNMVLLMNKSLKKYKKSKGDDLSLIQNGAAVLEPFRGSVMSEKKLKKSQKELDKYIKDFNREIMKYTRAFNNYNDELIKNNVASPGSIRNLMEINQKLVGKAQEIYFSSQFINGMDKATKRSIEIKRRELYKTIQELKEQQEKLNYSRLDDKTMTASFEDIKRMSDSTNIRYMLFLLGIVLLLLAIVKINRM
jgi:hypothetical protein